MSSLAISRRWLLIGMGAATAAFAMDAERRVAVRFDAGSSSRSFEDGISDFDVVTYIVPLRQGQSLRVVLASNNASNCFDIHAPHAPKPVYVGSEGGSVHQFTAATSGDHLVKVFLLRLAARDGQSAQYTLDLAVSG